MKILLCELNRFERSEWVLCLLDSGVMKTPKRRFLSLIFACLCISKALLIRIIIAITFYNMVLLYYILYYILINKVLKIYYHYRYYHHYHYHYHYHYCHLNYHIFLKMDLTWNAILRVFSPSFVPSKLTSNCCPYRFLRLVKCLKTQQRKEQPLTTKEASACNNDNSNGGVSCNGSSIDNSHGGGGQVEVTVAGPRAGVGVEVGSWAEVGAGTVSK